jgi:hypothetical protein
MRGVPQVAALVLKNLTFQTSATAPRRRGIGASGGVGFSAPSNRRADCMTCGPGPPCWPAGCSEAEGAHNRGAVVCLLRGSSPF